MAKQHVRASFSVGAGAYGECDIDITGLSPDEIADLVFNEAAPDTTLCHQCADHVSDPEVEELTGFSVGGVEYVKQQDGHWTVEYVGAS